MTSQSVLFVSEDTWWARTYPFCFNSWCTFADENGEGTWEVPDMVVDMVVNSGSKSKTKATRA